MPPTSHNHSKLNIVDFPAAMPPTKHTHNKVDITDFEHSHTTSDISDFPLIPSKVSDLTNDLNFIGKSNIKGLLKNDGTVDTSTYLTEHQDISGKVNYTDIVDNLTTNDSEKPLSAKQGKALAEMIGDIQTYVNR